MSALISDLQVWRGKSNTQIRPPVVHLIASDEQVNFYDSRAVSAYFLGAFIPRIFVLLLSDIIMSVRW